MLINYYNFWYARFFRTKADTPCNSRRTVEDSHCELRSETMSFKTLWCLYHSKCCLKFARGDSRTPANSLGLSCTLNFFGDPWEGPVQVIYFGVNVDFNSGLVSTTFYVFLSKLTYTYTTCNTIQFNFSNFRYVVSGDIGFVFRI